MVMVSAQFRKQLEEGLNTIVGLEVKRYPEEWKVIYDVETTNKRFEEDVTMAAFGTARSKSEGAGITYDEMEEVYVSRYVMETVGLGFTITEEAIEDNLYGNILQKGSKALTYSLIHYKETKGADILNNAFDSNFTGGDGVELCATNHPLYGPNAGTFANELATPADLSETALEDIVNGIAGFVDNRGLPEAIMPEKLIVPIQLQHQAHRLLYSSKRPGTGDNDINAFNDMGMFPGGYCVNRRLTDPDAFFVKTNAMDGLKHFVRRKLRSSQEGDFDTDNVRLKMTERYRFGWTNPRAIFASGGA